MKFFYTLLFVFLLCFESFCQSFSLPELIMMSKMDYDNFDTKVASKDFRFYRKINNEYQNGIEYAQHLNTFNSKAARFVTLYNKFHEYRYVITYQTSDNLEYINIKKQIKSLGFLLEDIKDHQLNDGSTANFFMYRKGKELIAVSVNPESFEIAYNLEY